MLPTERVEQILINAEKGRREGWATEGEIAAMAEELIRLRRFAGLLLHRYQLSRDVEALDIAARACGLLKLRRDDELGATWWLPVYDETGEPVND